MKAAARRNSETGKGVGQGAAGPCVTKVRKRGCGSAVEREAVRGIAVALATHGRRRAHRPNITGCRSMSTGPGLSPACRQRMEGRRDRTHGATALPSSLPILRRRGAPLVPALHESVATSTSDLRTTTITRPSGHRSRYERPASRRVCVSRADLHCRRARRGRPYRCPRELCPGSCVETCHASAGSP